MPPGEREKMAAAMEHSIHHELLNAWYPRSIDHQDGGFLSAFTYDFKPTGNQEKMIVTQARHVWSNAKAAEFYPTDTSYKANARHGFYFLRDYMWDKVYGGFFTLVNKQGVFQQSSLGIKMAYGNAFGIYALAAYYECSGDTAALNLAIKTFAWLEQHSHDNLHKGYFQHLERDGTPVQRPANALPTAETGYKDQNSSIHLLEAFTQLYRVWPDPLLRERLQEMLLLIRDTITTPQGYLILFFQPDWTPVSLRDSSRNTILQHHNLDYVSFGHNVETTYLLLEASAMLGLEHDTTTITIAKRMTDHALQNGWDEQAGGFYDDGFYFKDSTHISILRDTKNWWAQAEGLNTLLLLADAYPDDPHHYFQLFKKQWDYIQTYLIDHQYGDWYAGGLDKEPRLKTALKGQIWKATYHVFRSLSNCVERLVPDTIPPSAPAHLTGMVKNNGLLLSWSKAHDNRALLGYDIYRNGTRIGFTPASSFYVSGAGKTSDHFEVRAADVHGNQSAPDAFP